MKAKLISTTNHGMSHYAGVEGEFEIGAIALWTNHRREQRFSTSSIASYEYKDSLLTLHTLNSTYVFEITQGEFERSMILLATKEMVEEEEKINQTPSREYWCKSIAGVISVATLPWAMSLEEARDYAAYHTVLDMSGNIVTMILKAHTPL